MRLLRIGDVCAHGGTMTEHSQQHDDLRVAIYESSRDELIERIRLRDQGLIVYIASAGAYFEFFVKGSGQLKTPRDFLVESAVVMVLPLISLVFTFVILQHHIMIGRIGRFLQLNYPTPAHWDSHYASWSTKDYLKARTWAQGLLMVIPLAYAASFALSAIPAAKGVGWLQFLIGGTLALDTAILAFIVSLHRHAIRVRKETDALVVTAPLSVPAPQEPSPVTP
jgi:hypothetical protein